MSDVDPTHVELDEMFGGKAGTIETDPDEIEVCLTLQNMRSQLSDAAEHDDVGVSQLARRLHISPSAVSRTLNGEADMRISTAVLYARALGRRWDIVLTGDAACQATRNRGARMEVMTGIHNAATPVSERYQFDLQRQSDNAPLVYKAHAYS